MSFKSQPKGFATKAIHAGQEPEQWNSMCVVPPIVTSTTYKQDGPGENRGFEYSRSGNPTRNVLEKCLASLDNGQYGLTFSSGLGVTTAILTMLNSGDHIIVSDDVYGGSSHVIRQVASRMGINSDFVDLTNLAALKAAIKSNTQLIWFETPTNPMIKVIDIEAVTKVAHSNPNKIIVAIDNTFLTPYFQRPLELGADIVAYSLTKYMNGHNDVIMGAAVMNCSQLYRRLSFLQNACGIIPSPYDCYLVNRSLKTLAIRMEQHQKNGMKIARYLEKHPLVEKVIHPALSSHPQHELALRQTYGYSGVFSFYIKGNLEHSKKFLKALKTFTLAGSLGGSQSSAAIPFIMTHASVPAEEKIYLGITERLLRLSVGLEEADDLIDDLEAAFKAIEL